MAWRLAPAAHACGEQYQAHLCGLNKAKRVAFPCILFQACRGGLAPAG